MRDMYAVAAMLVRIILLCFLLVLPVRAETSAAGQINGTVIQKGEGRPLPYVTVTIKDRSGRTVRTTATDTNGRFAVEKLDPGTYELIYAALGGEILATGQVLIDPSHLTRSLGKVEASPAITSLEKI